MVAGLPRWQKLQPQQPYLLVLLALLASEVALDEASTILTLVGSCCRNNSFRKDPSRTALLPSSCCIDPSEELGRFAVSYVVLQHERVVAGDTVLSHQSF